jgi:hypothetical protein
MIFDSYTNCTFNFIVQIGISTNATDKACYAKFSPRNRFWLPSPETLVAEVCCCWTESTGSGWFSMQTEMHELVVRVMVILGLVGTNFLCSLENCTRDMVGDET